MAFFPTEEEGKNFKTIEAIIKWVGRNELVVPAIEKHAGAFADLPRNMALLPPIVIKEAVKVAKLTDAGAERLLTPVEAAQIGLVWRITRRKLSENWASWVDIDPFEDTGGAATPPRKAAETPTSNAKKLKMAHVLDQGDESEFTVADAGHINKWFHNFVAIMRGQPDEEETPTNEQLSALNVRVAVQLGSPFADFAVFTPYARKTTRAHRFTAYLPQPDGSWLAKEIPGPSNFQESGACDTSGPLPTENRKVGYTMAYSLAPCLSGGRQVQVRTLQPAEIADRVRQHSRPARSADVGCGVSLVSHFLEGSGGRRDSLGRQHSAPSNELAGTWKQGCPQGSRASGCGSHARRWCGGACSGNFGSSWSSVHVGSRHFKQSEGAPEQEGKVNGTTKRGEERSRDSAGKETERQGRRQGRKGRGARHTVDQAATQLCFSWNFGGGTCGELLAGSPYPAGRAHKCTTCRSDKHPARQCQQS